MDKVNFLKKNKWIFSLVVFIVFLLGAFSLIPSSTNQFPEEITPTRSPESSQNGFSEEDPKNFAHEYEFDPLIVEGATNQEVLTDGTIIYSVPSENPNRPDEVYVKNGLIVFKSVYIPISWTMKLSELVEFTGDPPWIFEGSKYYGDTIRVYVYPDMGLALIVDEDKDLVLEQHLFDPMPVEQYIERYGEDIPAR